MLIKTASVKICEPKIYFSQKAQNNTEIFH